MHTRSAKRLRAKDRKSGEDIRGGGDDDDDVVVVFVRDMRRFDIFANSLLGEDLPLMWCDGNLPMDADRRAVVSDWSVDTRRVGRPPKRPLGSTGERATEQTIRR